MPPVEPPVPQQIRFCTSRDGTRIAYATCGGGPPLVWVQHWVHHLELDWHSSIWRPWLTLLTRRHTLIRFDWRGCGLSDRDDIEFSFENYVADLEAVVTAAGNDRFALFGMAGSGCGMAMSYATRHPERVTRMVLQAAHIRGRLAGIAVPAARVLEAQARLKVIELGWLNETPAYGQFFTALHMPDATTVQMKAYNDLLRQVTSPLNATGLLKTFWETDVSGIVARVSCPTLVLHSRGDSVIPFGDGREVAALIPGAQLVPLDSRNHLLLNTEGAWPQFVQTLQDFIGAPSDFVAAASFDALTAREREVLDVLAQGLDNTAIGIRLRISEKTVRNHVSVIFGKLSVTSRAQAVALARDAGLGRRNVR
jgi:pimeloyl-ACP methyl ester carboxylesterase/DNA-binding CsgD family transcriptional regulator